MLAPLINSQVHVIDGATGEKHLIPSLEITFEIWYFDEETEETGLASDIMEIQAVHDTFEEALKTAMAIDEAYHDESYTFSIALNTTVNIPQNLGSVGFGGNIDIVTVKPNGIIGLCPDFFSNNGGDIILQKVNETLEKELTEQK